MSSGEFLLNGRRDILAEIRHGLLPSVQLLVMGMLSREGLARGSGAREVLGSSGLIRQLLTSDRASLAGQLMLLLDVDVVSSGRKLGGSSLPVTGLLTSRDLTSGDLLTRDRELLSVVGRGSSSVVLLLLSGREDLATGNRLSSSVMLVLSSHGSGVGLSIGVEVVRMMSGLVLLVLELLAMNTLLDLRLGGLTGSSNTISNGNVMVVHDVLVSVLDLVGSSSLVLLDYGSVGVLFSIR